MSNEQSDEIIDRVIAESIRFYAKNYQLQTWEMGKGKDKVVLGSKGINKCRFCLRSSPEASFRNEAHAIPESLGNKSIFTRYECDECNQRFGNTIENDLGSWFLPIRTFSGIKGKNNYPTIKSRDGKSRIESSLRGINIAHQSDNRFFSSDEENKILTFNVPVPKYRPIGVWKSFIKIGLSLIDENRIGYFEDTIKWLVDDPKGHQPIRMWPVQSYFIPGPGRSDSISVSMLYRIDDYVKLPYAMLFIMYGSQSFQVIIPSNRKDFAVEAPSFQLPMLLPFDEETAKQYGFPRVMQFDLSRTDFVEDEEVTIQGTYDTVIQLENSDESEAGGPNPDP